MIDDGCFIGSGAVLHEGIKVGMNSVISAGQIVLRMSPVIPSLNDITKPEQNAYHSRSRS